MEKENLPFFLRDLNEGQLEAATSTEGPLLILAGAGSGKTKTIVARTANIVYKKLAAPEEILVMTFTNKAAREMRERGKALLSREMPELRGRSAEFSTFHSWGLAFLKKMDAHILANVHLRPGFTIADDLEKEKIVKAFCDEKFPGIKISAASFLSAASQMENDLLFEENAIANRPETHEKIVNFVYSAFKDPVSIENPVSLAIEVRSYLKNTLRQMNMVDFDDMITLPYLILFHENDIRSRIHNAYKYIMVDEFQDTNVAQLQLLKLLINPRRNNICVVGDDFQSIYGWRGAEIENILGFHKNFEGTKIVNLKINYRSCSKIVQAGNSLLENAEIKHENKEPLVPYHKEEGYIEVRSFENEYQEAAFVADKIEEVLRAGTPPSEIAVLSRINMLMQSVENELVRRRVRYRIYGAKSFLERKFVKEVLSYLKFLVNPSDLQFQSVLLGFDVLTENALSKLRKLAEESGESLLYAAKALTESGDFKKIGLRGEKREMFPVIISSIFSDMEKIQTDYAEYMRGFDIGSWIAVMENRRVLKNNSQSEKAMANLGLLSRIKEIALSFESAQEFLDSVYMERDEESDAESISLMSIHKSKGLEFENVFVIGFADGILPLSKSEGNIKLEEEERRLAYVAITRAKKRLYLTYAETYRGKEDFFSVSRYYTASNLHILADITRCE